MQTLLLDIGGSGIKYAIISDAEAPNLKNMGKFAGVDNGMEEILSAIGQIYGKFRDIVDGVAVCACMVLDTQTGFVYTGGSYTNIKNINLQDAISQVCDGKPVIIESDGDCCLRAELTYGVLQGCENAAVFVFGTGIGCAFIADGHIIRGAGSAAGEVSTCAADSRYADDGPAFWAHVSGVGHTCDRICRRCGLPPHSLDGFDLFRMFRAGEQNAVLALNELCDEAARQIFNYCMLMSPEKIAIGGGISSEPELVVMIRERVEQYYKAIERFAVRKRPVIIAAKYRNQANLLGAYVRLQEASSKSML